MRSWGRKDAKYVMLCVHGLTRNAADFDFFANYLLRVSHGNWRVVSIDVVGRGDSDWLYDKTQYSFFTYVTDVVTVIQKLRETMPSDGKLFYIGTSMGGLIAICMCAGMLPLTQSPVDALILNDIGPFVPREGILLVQEYLRTAEVHFDNPEDAVSFQWNHYSPLFGKHGVDPTPTFGSPDGTTPRENPLRTVMALSGVYEDSKSEADYQAKYPDRDIERDRATGRYTGSGKWRPAYDHDGICVNQLAEAKDVDLFGFFDNIKIPTVVLRGGKSELLREEHVRELSTHGPRALEIVYPDAGHVPPLFLDEDNALIWQWIQSTLKKLEAEKQG